MSRAVLYLHGGAFLAGGLNTHRAIVSRISKAADSVVLNVGYRMLPTHPISAAVDDAVAGYRWLCDAGYSGDDIVVAGDSAGGYLAFMTALSLGQAGLPKPAGVVAMSPLTEFDATRKLAHPNANRCAMFPARALPFLDRYIDRAYARIRVEGEQGPLVSPVDEDLRGMPPVLMHVAKDELLYSDADLMAERLRRSGVRCDLHVWEGQVHAFPVTGNLTPESRSAIAEIGQFVRDETAARALAS
jgi:acetyl esterase/lipase